MRPSLSHSPGVKLAVRAYQERRGAEQGLALAERDLVVAKMGLEIAQTNLKDCRDEEAYLMSTLTDSETAEVLQEVLSQP